MTPNHLIKLIKHSKIFASIASNKAVLEALIQHFEEISLAKDEVLYHQGSASDSISLLVTGKLSAVLLNKKSDTKIIGDIIPGEVIGEFGVLAGEPRSLTVKAVENSTVLKLDAEIFKKLCHQYPGILLETINPIIHRSQRIIQLLSPEEQKQHIAIIPTCNDIVLEKFMEKMRELLLSDKDIYIFNETDVVLDSLKAKNTQHSSQIKQTINQAEQSHDILIYFLKPYDTPLAKACWEKINTVYILGNGNSEAHICSFALKKLHELKNLIQVRRELILTFEGDTIPQRTSRWLKLANFFQHHNIRIEQTRDYQRLLRFIKGETVGVVLGGGGVKGWAHMGALKALLEANIPIDAIGGTSVGAVICGLYALFENYEDTQRCFNELVQTTTGTISLKNLVWPVVSLFNFKNFTVEIQKLPSP